MKQVCDDGAIKEMTEENAKQQCPGVWEDVNLWNTPDHCGDCNNKCAKGQLCEKGECVNAPIPYDPKTVVIQSCNSGYYSGYEEYDVNKGDDGGYKHCGYCGKRCEKTACDRGLCGITCDGIEEIDKQSDSYYCGGCVGAGEDMPGETCKKGFVCKSGQCQEDNTPIVTCKGVSGINLLEDSANCGNCGNKLPEAKLGEGNTMQYFTCQNGMKESGNVSKTICNKAPTDLKNDSLNCGQCDNVCGRGMHCEEGQCKSMPKNGLKVPENTKDKFFHIICGYTSTDKDETRVKVALPAVDSNNCGGCGIKCERGKYCNEGECEPFDRDTMATSYCGTSEFDYGRLSSILKGRNYAVSYYNNGVNHKYDGRTLGTIIDGSNYCGYVEGAISQDGAPSGYKTAGIYRTLSYDPKNCGACGYNCKEQLDGDRDYYCIGGKCVWNDVIKQCKEDHEENTGKPSDYCMCK